MRTIKRKMVTAVATIVLLSSVAFADGEMGGGGIASYDTSTEKVNVNTSDGEMGGGGRSSGISDEYGIYWLITAIGDFLSYSE